MYRFYDAWLFLHRLIILISSLDQRFSCRYTSSFGNWVIFNSLVFNDTFQYFLSILSLLGHMINFLIDMCYEIVHFCIPKFKIERVKSK